MTDAIEKKTRLLFNLGVVCGLMSNQKVYDELLNDGISIEAIDGFKDALKRLVSEFYKSPTPTIIRKCEQCENTLDSDYIASCPQCGYQDDDLSASHVDLNKLPGQNCCECQEPLVWVPIERLCSGCRMQNEKD